MISIVVVTSWWSNCLALMCLHQLVRFAPGRRILVMQGGKSEEQMRRFRRYVPGEVVELHYPERKLVDDSVMREHLALEVLRDHEGAWFFDHDTFLTAPAEAWLYGADAVFEKSRICLCTRRPSPRSGITQPAYWLSPSRWPRDLSSFDPVPFRPKPYVRRPDLHRHDGRLTLPEMDTLVKVREELDERGMAADLPLEDSPAGGSPLPVFPPHLHIGGLHLYSSPPTPPADMPTAYLDWRRQVLARFEEFFLSCPGDWLDIEEPELLRRHGELFRQASGKRSGVP